MKAGHIVAPWRMEIVDVPVPSLDGFPGVPVLVKMHAGVLCASDYPRFTGEMFDIGFPRPVGDSLHEIIGEVVESRSPRFQPGDRVLAIPPDQRGLSEYFLADAGLVVPLPEFAAREQLILAQPLGTVIWAMRKLGNLIHANCVVLGQGPIGLLFNQLLAMQGARRVIGVDKLDYRLQAGRRLGATHTLHPERDALRDAVLDLTEGRGADVVIEAVGHDESLYQTAVQLARREGTVLLFGLPTTRDCQMPVFDILLKNLRIVGSIHPESQRDWPLALDMITQGRIQVAPLITHRYRFDQAPAAFVQAIEKNDGPIKILLEAAG